jgi:HPt (histidine-containing phosphotransfer) domain-containing protein
MEPSENQAHLINWATALEMAGGDPDLMKELVQVFVDEGQQLLREIHNSLAAGDAALLRRSAHTLKGSLRIFEATPAAALAEQMETMGQQANLDAAEPVVAELDTFMVRVFKELNDHLGR